MITRRRLLRTVGAGVMAMFGLAGYALAEPFVRLRTVRYALVPPDWPPGLKLRIVVLADIHACNPWMTAGRIRAICEQANALEPDIFLLLGDYVSGMRLSYGDVAADDWAQALSSLNAPLGVHAVLGNHDWWQDRRIQEEGIGHPFARQALEATGIPVYSNRAARLIKDGQPFWIAGIEDQLAILGNRKLGRRARGEDDLAGTLAQVTDDAPVVLMAHEPDIFPQVPARVSLTVCGHTHGGQVRLFGYAPVVPSRYGDRYVYGHVREEGRDLIISGGLGCSGLPIRFGAPPELVLVDLG